MVEQCRIRVCRGGDVLCVALQDRSAVRCASGEVERLLQLHGSKT